MRQRLAIIISIAVVLVLLIALNTASYVSTERQPDTEFAPDRSTSNAGATGTLALFELLAASRRKVMRWREKPDALLNAVGDNAPATFVVIGKTRVPFEADEAESLLRWVYLGGRLVIIDRRPDVRLLPVSGNWRISTSPQALPRKDVHPESTDELTVGVAPVQAALPSVFTRNIQTVLPSRFAATINVTSSNDVVPPPPVAEAYEESEDLEPQEVPSQSYPEQPSQSVEFKPLFNSPAPVAHIEDHRGALLVDYPYGAGRIVILSDPFIIANNGISLADNVQLAINSVSSTDGMIAFDEYHQGRGATGNLLIAYFAGTPIMWMFAQGIFIVLVILWTRGRRFARPLPVTVVDRRSSLEFVASMAELQQRARAFDLAIENIYTRLRRVLVRYAGVGHNSPRSEIAARVSTRSEKVNAARLEALMHECEDAINGTPVDERKALELVRQMRTVERILGLRVRSREARQTAEGLQQNTL